MNIAQAKDEIKHTVQAYLKKDTEGNYRIPAIRQRPILLIGPPGIGKTQIMEQIASECGVGLVAYTITHHTRQSAVGLPMITQETYEGDTYSVTEYTMSEIIASVYRCIRDEGKKEGILFIDEINCVSETLTPAMLQFLQCKTFGNRAVPQGWIIVAAGNPPEYNKSVREFDVVTMDRLKVLSVEADYRVWKEYAQERGLHTAILNFLELKKEYFYKIETTVNGRSYVTARGWEDLSEILTLYEEEGMKVDETLVEQYLRNDKIVREFTAYYDLFNKYKKEYQTEEILNGTRSEQTVERARIAAFDERLSLLGMLVDKMMSEIRENMETSDYLSDLFTGLKAIKSAVEKQTEGEKSVTVEEMLEKQADARKKQMEASLKAGNLSETEKRKNNRIVRFLEEAKKELYLDGQKDALDAFAKVKAKFEKELSEMKTETMKIKARLENLFSFVEEAFAEGNEMLILVTELTVNHNSARFISRFGCDAYQKHNENLMLTERQTLLKEEIAALDL